MLYFFKVPFRSYLWPHLVITCAYLALLCLTQSRDQKLLKSMHTASFNDTVKAPYYVLISPVANAQH